MARIGLLPTPLDIDLYSGDSFTASFQFNDDSDPPGAVDLSSYTFNAQVRSDQTDTGTPTTFSIDTTGAASGTIVIHLTPAQTTALLLARPGGSKAAGLTWDLQRTVTGSSDDVRTLFAGTVTITLDRTRL